MAAGLLGKGTTISNQYTEVYAAPSVGVEFSTVNINIVNTSTSVAEVDVAITTSTTPTANDLVGWKDELVSNGGSVEYSCYVISPGEKVFVRSTNSETIVRVSGLEKLL